MSFSNSISAGDARLRDQHDYLRLLSARVTGGGANQMLMVALGWQMYDLTASAWNLGLVGLAQFLPALLLTLPAGHLVDRHDRGPPLAGSLKPAMRGCGLLGAGQRRGLGRAEHDPAAVLIAASGACAANARATVADADTGSGVPAGPRRGRR